MQKRSILILLFALLICFQSSSPALSLAPATTLGEVVGSVDALSDWDRDFAGSTYQGSYQWSLDFLGLNTGYFWPSSDTSQNSMWGWVNGSWMYGRGNRDYFYLPSLGSWTYNSPGTAWFYDFSTNSWFDLRNGPPAP